eukprot:gene7360-9746_t
MLRLSRGIGCARSFGSAWTTYEQRISGVFGKFAAEYNALRPDYPKSMWTTIINMARTTDCSLLHVADIGAGTGRGAMYLIQCPKVGHVSVVEPDAGMLSLCRQEYHKLNERLMKKSAQNHIAPADFIQATAEETQLDAISLDLAVCLQAWHWVDNAAGLREITRILKPGAVFAVAWNDRDVTKPWVAELESLIERYNPCYERQVRQCDKYGMPLSQHNGLQLIFQGDIENSLTLNNPHTLVDLTHTFSYVRHALDEEQMKRFDNECFQLAQSEYCQQTNNHSSSPFSLPLVTRLYILRKR